MGDASASGGSRYCDVFETTNEHAGPPSTELKRVNEFNDIVSGAIVEIKEELRKRGEKIHRLFSRKES